jgi:purine-nucleoside phosphorylase
MLSSKLQETLAYIRTQTELQPVIGLILGSGLGGLAKEITGGVTIDYKDIPNFPVSTVEGHAGQLVLGELLGKLVVAMQGRFHHYEGYSMQEVTYPVRVMHQLGVKTLLVTNAAGGVNTDFVPGDLMLISDHINLMGDNPLIGPNLAEFGPRFPDMSEAYNKALGKVAEDVAKQVGFKLKKGIYAGLNGPSYETPAEIRYLRAISVDAVGMSTVPEVLVANHSGLKVVGISCITNMAAGILDVKLDHQEVMEVANRVQTRFLALVKGIIAKVS